jgi:predicted flavoprotein YhiN
MAKLVKSLKEWRLEPRQMRSLKEAMVTVGGVTLKEIDPETMQSRLRPGLYFAGEVMDVDGPSGGYNLHAAFASAALAVRSIAGKK